MAKKPAPSYAGLSLDLQPLPSAPSPADEGVPKAVSQIPASSLQPRSGGKPRNDDGKVEKGQPYVTYLHPKGHRALRLYALEAGSSVQGIIIEALENWAKKHGITEPMRPLRTK